MPKTTAPSKGIKHEGSLTSLGYNLEEPAEKRKAALLKAVKEYGYKETMDKLVDLEVLNKNKAPKVSETAHSDMDFLRQRHEKPASKKK